MEIGRWLYYAVNCALLCYITAKPFSLNKLIESESNRKEVIYTTFSPKIEETKTAAERFSLNKGLKPSNRIPKKFKETGTKLNLIPLGKISPLKYRKTFQIKSPLKPKRVKNSLRVRHKRKNQSIKREIDGNDILNKKYVPLLKSLGMLFDNILGTDSGESYEKPKHKKRPRYYYDEDDKVSCKCSRQRDTGSDTASQETVTFSEVVTSETTATTETPTKTTDNPPTSDFRSFRHHTNVPLLLPRNTLGARRNYHGIGERGRASHNGSAERYISGSGRDSEHNSEYGQEQTHAKSVKAYTDSDSRNDASSAQSREAIRGGEHRNNAEEVYDAVSQDEAENFLERREDTTQHNRAYKHKMERDKAKSGNLLSEPIRERGFLSDDKVVDYAESIQSEKDDKESVISISHDSTSSERLTDGDGAHSAENKKVDSRIETVNPISKQNDDYDEKNVNISYGNSEPNIDTNDSKSEEHWKTDIVSKTTFHDEPIQSRFKTSKVDKTVNSVEIIQNDHKEEDENMKHKISNDEFNEDDTYSTGEEANGILNTTNKVEKLAEIENSQPLSKHKSIKGPVVTIIDGYSVTRHKNGENNLAGKAIRIRP